MVVDTACCSWRSLLMISSKIQMRDFCTAGKTKSLVWNSAYISLLIQSNLPSPNPETKKDCHGELNFLLNWMLCCSKKRYSVLDLVLLYLKKSPFPSYPILFSSWLKTVWNIIITHSTTWSLILIGYLYLSGGWLGADLKKDTRKTYVS